MVEGQEGVTWDQWVALAEACENAGLEGLFRSDHYSSLADQADRGSLDAWSTLAALGAITERIRLGTMVSPVTFRHPSHLARAVVSADHTSRGRVELGIGAGWHDGEHAAHGFPFPELGERFEILEEQTEIIVREWTETEPFDVSGKHYALEGANAQPKPVQSPRPPIIVGGLAAQRSARLAARWADEYNTVFAHPDDAADRWQRISEVVEREGRDPATLTYSVMTGFAIGADEDDLAARAERIVDFQRNNQSGREWLEGLGPEWVTGTVDDAVDHLQHLEEAGVERVMLQLQDHTDTEMVVLLGEVAAKVS